MRRRRRIRALAGAALLATSAGGLFENGLASEARAAVILANRPTKLVSTSSVSAASVAAAVDSAIVDVNTTLEDREGTAAGTGMIITSNGYIVTNNHVVEDSVAIKVTIPGHGTYAATVVGTDVSKDIAILKVNVSGLMTVRFASSTAAVGTSVVAIGNALGKGGTPAATSGTIVALAQTLSAQNDDGSSETLQNAIETSASLDPGDSGGPLLSASGEVVAMDTAAESTMSYGGSSYSYAIPVKEIITVADDILAGKRVDGIIVGKTAFLGVETSSASGGGGPFAGEPFGSSSQSGVVVEQVVSGSPAAKAGVEAGEEIVAFDGTTVMSASQLKDLIVAKTPGTTVTLTITTATGATETVNATLTSGPVA